MEDLDLNLDFDWEDEPEQKEPKAEEPEQKKGIAVKHRMGYRNMARKVSSEQALENAMLWHFEPGDCFHCFSFGDVDSFTFLKMVMRQQRIEYLALSTWCMAGEDVKELMQWHRRGMIGRVDFFMGEIFKGSYPDVYWLVKKFIKQCGGRLVVFRNHSKVMAIKGDRFDCLIESSANVNTNPRSENTVITVDAPLVAEYIKLFGEITPFNDDYGAEPYKEE